MKVRFGNDTDFRNCHNLVAGVREDEIIINHASLSNLPDGEFNRIVRDLVSEVTDSEVEQNDLFFQVIDFVTEAL